MRLFSHGNIDISFLLKDIFVPPCHGRCFKLTRRPSSKIGFQNPICESYIYIYIYIHVCIYIYIDRQSTVCISVYIYNIYIYIHNVYIYIHTQCMHIYIHTYIQYCPEVEYGHVKKKTRKWFQSKYRTNLEMWNLFLDPPLSDASSCPHGWFSLSPS